LDYFIGARWRVVEVEVVLGLNYVKFGIGKEALGFLILGLEFVF
jgi:hypothetical protein